MERDTTTARGRGRLPTRAYEKKRRSSARVLPLTMAPQLATLVNAPPEGDGWLYEIKLDGYRMLARIEDGSCRLFSRNGKDWTARLPAVAEALSTWPVGQAWIDGEVVVQGKSGVPDFQALQNSFAESAGKQVFFAFDLLFLDGEDLRMQPLIERKARLRQVISGAGMSPAVAFSTHSEGDGAALLEKACRRGFEGLIAKRADAVYQSRRSRSWLKLKCKKRQEFVVVGYTDPTGSRKGFGALLLGVRNDSGELVHAGRVGTGFDARALRDVGAQLDMLTRDTAAVRHSLSRTDSAGTHWVQPKLVAEVSFAEWTGDGLIRQGVFHGLRDDKDAGAVHTESAISPPQNRARVPSDPEVEGVRITHPERVVFPDSAITKLDLARYYASVGHWLLPQLRGRPLSLVRCPEGTGKGCFFHKHAMQSVAQVDIVDVQEVRGPARYMVANTIAGVIALVQMRAIEFHTWGSRQPRVDCPDRMVFDLDPDIALSWQHTVEAAQLTRALLDELGLKAFVKTSGGKGLHIVVPLQRRHDWDDVKRFSQAVAAHLAQQFPDRFTANMAKARRKGKVFVDYLRNGPGATTVAAFSARARPHAPVSMPLAWDELHGVTADRFTVVNVHEHLQSRRADPWADYDKHTQILTAAMRRTLGISDRIEV